MALFAVALRQPSDVIDWLHTEVWNLVSCGEKPHQRAAELLCWGGLTKCTLKRTLLHWTERGFANRCCCPLNYTGIVLISVWEARSENRPPVNKLVRFPLRKPFLFPFQLWKDAKSADVARRKKRERERGKKKWVFSIITLIAKWVLVYTVG